MSKGESRRHLALKRAAVAWARENGYRVRSTEIRLPSSNYRADVAAYRPASQVVDLRDDALRTTRRQRQAEVGDTAIFECKQSRPDFLKDSRSAETTLPRLRDLHRRRETLERLLRVHYPSLRQGDSLFPEFESVAFDAIPHRTYQRVIREIRILEKRVHDRTKFERILRYGCANACYAVVVEGLIEAHELPLGWGLLVAGREAMEAWLAGEQEIIALELKQKPARLELPDSKRLELLHLIATSTSQRLNRQLGLETETGRPLSLR